MHELSIAVEIIERLAELRAEHHGTPIQRVTLAVGGLSGVDPAALELAFPVAVEGTDFEQTHFEIRPVQAAVICQDCGRQSEPDTLFPVCTSCGSTDVTIIRGRELLISEVELETTHV